MDTLWDRILYIQQRYHAIKKNSLDRQIDISPNIRGDNKHGHKVKVTIIIQWHRTDLYVGGATAYGDRIVVMQLIQICTKLLVRFTFWTTLQLSF